MWLATVLTGALLAHGPRAGAASGEPVEPEAQRALIAVYPKNFPPIFTLTENGIPTGFGIEIMEAVAARAGLKIVYRSTDTWPEAIKALRSGEADLVPNMGITPARLQDFDFTRPVLEIPVSIFVQADNDDIAGLEDLAGAERGVAVVRENVALRIFQEHPEIHLKVFPSVNDAFVALSAGQVDALAYPRPVIEQIAQDLGIDHRVRAVGEPLVEIERAVAVRKGDAGLLERINPAVDALLASGAHRDIYARWYPEPPAFWTPRGIIFTFTLLLLAFLAYFIIWRVRTLARTGARQAALNAFNRAVVEAVADGIIVLNAQGIIESVNRAGTRMFGAERVDLLGQKLETLFPAGEADWLRARIVATAPGSEVESWEAMSIRGDGEMFPVRVGLVATESGGRRLWVCSIHDMTEQRRAERQAEYIADHDILTGLLNQRGATLVVDNLLQQARRHGRSVAGVMFDIAHLSHINNAYGRQVGDGIVIQTASFISTHLRGSDVVACDSEALVAHLGGDRFLVVMPETNADGARAAGQRLMAALSRHAFQAGDTTLHLDANIGIAAFPEDAEDPGTLVSRAELALHTAKREGVSVIHVYRRDDEHYGKNVEQWLERIRRATLERQFIVHFQPVLHIASGEIRHHEALVRLPEPDGTLVPPAKFIPLAERYGLIQRIDFRVLELAFSHLAGMEEHKPNIALAVNLSASHLGDDDLFRWLDGIFTEGGISPKNLIFEITETAAVTNILRARDFMEPLKSFGCRFALDDFGVGFTSFSHLRALPFDMVKIDGMFIRNLHASPKDQVLVQSMTSIAHSLGIEVVAEFVEDERALELLARFGVDHAQGYLIGRPGAELQDAPPQLAAMKRRHPRGISGRGKQVS